MLNSGEVDEDSQAWTPFKQRVQLMADLGNGHAVNNPGISKLDEKYVVAERNNKTRELLRHPKPFATARRVQKKAVNVLSRCKRLGPVGI